ncbi:MAG: TAT-variant-translocated molybdopterin oxidoreductase [Phycisphaerales bacterium]|jgi:molybdopterin-containing oxidoreductase family iron-sulfur binding subunit|nr:TAT-variant-translocated molybdopterin oxidoreductase [Phycisphaerales bacterium]
MDHCPGKTKEDLLKLATAGVAADEQPLRGERYWRSLEEFSNTKEFEELVHREFPEHASEWLGDLSRRNFLKVMGASLALAGLGVAGCTRGPDEAIVPYVYPPEEVVPGKPLFYASAMTLGGYAQGVVVEQHEGRPTKIEGNPDHPSSLGSTNVWMQASILSMYDPNRAQTPKKHGEISSWNTFLKDFDAWVGQHGGRGKIRVGLLSGSVTSPTLYARIQELRKAYPNLRWHQYEPAGYGNVTAGAQLAFGRPVNTVYDFSKAQRILSLDSNFLLEDPGSLRYARQFIQQRRVKFRKGDGTDRMSVTQTGRLAEGEGVEVPTADTMSRLYVAESTLTITGAKADHRLPLNAAQIHDLAQLIAAQLGVAGSNGNSELRTPEIDHWVSAVAKDLQSNGGRSLVIVGDHQPAAVHAIAHAINAKLGNVGSTVFHTDPVQYEPVEPFASLKELTDAMNGGQLDLLVMLGGNPVYDAPVDLAFEKALDKVPMRVHLSSHYNETSFLCHWHIPQSFYLESWGDARGHDGTASIIQPLIAPLYSTRSDLQLLGAMLGKIDTTDHETVRAYWQGQLKMQGLEFDKAWEAVLRNGVIPGTAANPVRVEAKLPAAADKKSANGQPAGGIEIVFRRDNSVWDGSYANNGWLQELAKPLVKLTWGNAAMISPWMAAEMLKIAPSDHPEDANGHVVELSYRGRKLRLPVWVMPGQPKESVTVHLGYGRTRAGDVGDGVGANTYLLRGSDAPWFDNGLTISVTGEKVKMACTQNHQVMHGRDLVRSTTIDEARKELQSTAGEHGESHGESGHRTVGLTVVSEEESLYPEWPYTGYKWGMVIDQTACIGCNSCVVACQSENNIPVVGVDLVLRGREMHWLRIDTYYGPDRESMEVLSNPDTMFQPMMCQHCEKAPCEVVCPVGATTHSEEGINEMTYNRCVGTRYCSNNCPYKVRRFNFLQYADTTTPSLKLMRNPEVTVRSRGVMEKCNYCIQRIDHARIDSKKKWVAEKESGRKPTNRGRVHAEDQELPPIDLVTACQQSCPTEAIIFGDMNDSGTVVHRMKETEPYTQLNYGVLVELNTQPRTTYLKRLRNPNPELTSSRA